MKRFPAVLLAALLPFSCARPALQHADWAPDVRSALNDFIAPERLV